MAKVFIVSVDDDLPEYDEVRQYAVRALRASASIDRFRKHSSIEDHEAADIILFVEMGTCGDFAERVRAHPLYRRYPEKCFLFDWVDYVRPVMPGVYASLRRKHYSPEQARTGFYVKPENPLIDYRPLTGNERYLASFVGSSNTHPVREEIFKFNRPDIYLLDSSKESYRVRFHGSADERTDFWKRYADSIGDASFSLCPGGRAPGTVRLYESMKVGRGCIILSDEWPPNEDVDWNSFAVFVPEKDVAKVPALLDELKSRAKEMGERARAEWEKWFAEDVQFHWVVELCLKMLEARAKCRLQGRLRRIYHLRYIISSYEDFHRYMMNKKHLYRLHHKIFW